MKRNRIVVVLAVLWLGAGCGGGSSGGDEDLGGLPDAAEQDVDKADVAAQDGTGADLQFGDGKGDDVRVGGDVADSAWRPAACPGMPNLTGKSYRVTHMEATKPIDDLNEVWNNEIAKYFLVLVFYIIEHDEENGKLKVRVGPCKAQAEQLEDGAWVAYGFNYIQDANVPEVTMDLDGCNFSFDDPIALDVLTPTVSKAFPVSITSGHGVFIKKGLEMEKVDLVGYIKESETFDLCMTMPPFGEPNVHWLFNLLHLCPDLDLDGDGVKDAYEFEGWLSTEITDLLDPETSVVLESLVEECLIDQVECKP